LKSNKSESESTLSKIFKLWLGPIILVVVASAGAWLLIDKSLSRLETLRQLERILPSDVGLMLAGSVTAEAQALVMSKTLTSYYGKRDSIYYRYVKEEEYEDSDGDTRWRTVFEQQDAVDFWLVDYTGRAQVHARAAQHYIDWQVKRSLYETSNGYRHSEWIIAPGERIFIFGQVELFDGLAHINHQLTAPNQSIIANQPKTITQGYLGVRSVLYLWGGLACVALAVLGIIFLFRIHRVLVFLSILSFVLILVLTQIALVLMKRDLSSAVNQHHLQTLAATEEATRVFNLAKLSWPGWADALGVLSQSEDLLDKNSALRIKAYFHYLEANRIRLHKHMNTFPAVFLCRIWGLSQPASLAPMTDEDKRIVQKKAEALPKAEVRQTWVMVMLLVSGLLGLVATLCGYFAIKLKRLIENIPATPTAGVSCGSAEITGEILLLPSQMPLRSPYSHSPCVWFFYRVEERVGSGKNKSWKTIEKTTSDQRFICRDQEGQLLVDPKNAEIITRHNMTKTENNIRYTEQYLGVHDSLYALGNATIDREQPDRLILMKGKDGEPMLISNYSEKEVMLSKARLGMTCFTFATVSLLMSILLAFAQQGQFTASGFLISALVTPAYLIAVMLTLHYNDLIFLRRRAERNWANIQVALAKRKNVMVGIEPIVKQMLKHERELTVALTQLRAQLPQATDSVADAGLFLAGEARFAQSIRVAIEQYPQLRSDALVSKYMSILSSLETEIALLRQGYNDAVTYYNTRIQTIPDVIFARLFGFRRMSLLYVAG
jgi:hypothetical protein